MCNPTLKVIKNKYDKQNIIGSTEQLEYFEELLNGKLLDKPIPVEEDQITEQEINYIKLDETKIAINYLKKWKATGSNGFPVELIKYN